MIATMKLLERQVLFCFRDKYVSVNVNAAGNIITYVHGTAFDKVIKSFISCYMVFVKEVKEGLSDLNVSKDETKEKLELSTFLNKLHDILMDDISRELPPKKE